jgi:rhodanese-related sulfurtransferase
MERKTWMAVMALALLALLVAACGAGSGGVDDPGKNADGYADISVEELAAMLEEKDLTLVNVHIPYQGEIPQTDLFVPFDDIGAYLDQLPDKDAPIVLYCRSGSMSTTAAQELVGLGYSNVMELDGGFNAWEAAGYELLDEGR